MTWLMWFVLRGLHYMTCMHCFGVPPDAHAYIHINTRHSSHSSHTHHTHLSHTHLSHTHTGHSHNYPSPLHRTLHDAPGYGPSSECIHITAACSGTAQGYPWLVKSIALHLYIGMELHCYKSNAHNLTTSKSNSSPVHINYYMQGIPWACLWVPLWNLTVPLWTSSTLSESAVVMNMLSQQLATHE